MMSATSESDVVPLGAATHAWAVISLQTFGGPAGQIAVMQRELVDERRLISAAPRESQPSELRPLPAVVTLAALVMVFVLRWPVHRTVGICCLLGLGGAWAGLPLT